MSACMVRIGGCTGIFRGIGIIELHRGTEGAYTLGIEGAYTLAPPSAAAQRKRGTIIEGMEFRVQGNS